MCRVVSLRITSERRFHLSLLFEVRVVAKWLVRDQLLLSEEQGAAFATGEDFRRDELFRLLQLCNWLPGFSFVFSIL